MNMLGVLFILLLELEAVIGNTHSPTVTSAVPHVPSSQLVHGKKSDGLEVHILPPLQFFARKKGDTSSLDTSITRLHDQPSLLHSNIQNKRHNVKPKESSDEATIEMNLDRTSTENYPGVPGAVPIVEGHLENIFFNKSVSHERKRNFPTTAPADLSLPTQELNVTPEDSGRRKLGDLGRSDGLFQKRALQFGYNIAAQRPKNRQSKFRRKHVQTPFVVVVPENLHRSWSNSKPPQYKSWDISHQGFVNLPTSRLPMSQKGNGRNRKKSTIKSTNSQLYQDKLEITPDLKVRTLSELLHDLGYDGNGRSITNPDGRMKFLVSTATKSEHSEQNDKPENKTPSDRNDIRPNFGNDSQNWFVRNDTQRNDDPITSASELISGNSIRFVNINRGDHLWQKEPFLQTSPSTLKPFNPSPRDHAPSFYDENRRLSQSSSQERYTKLEDRNSIKPVPVPVDPSEPSDETLQQKSHRNRNDYLLSAINHFNENKFLHDSMKAAQKKSDLSSEHQLQNSISKEVAPSEISVSRSNTDEDSQGDNPNSFKMARKMNSVIPSSLDNQPTPGPNTKFMLSKALNLINQVLTNEDDEDSSFLIDSVKASTNHRDNDKGNIISLLPLEFLNSRKRLTAYKRSTKTKVNGFESLRLPNKTYTNINGIDESSSASNFAKSLTEKTTAWQDFPSALSQEQDKMEDELSLPEEMTIPNKPSTGKLLQPLKPNRPFRRGRKKTEISDRGRRPNNARGHSHPSSSHHLPQGPNPSGKSVFLPPLLPMDHILNTGGLSSSQGSSYVSVNSQSDQSVIGSSYVTPSGPTANSGYSFNTLNTPFNSPGAVYQPATSYSFGTTFRPTPSPNSVSGSAGYGGYNNAPSLPTNSYSTINLPLPSTSYNIPSQGTLPSSYSPLPPSNSYSPPSSFSSSYSLPNTLSSPGTYGVPNIFTGYRAPSSIGGGIASFPSYLGTVLEGAGGTSSSYIPPSMSYIVPQSPSSYVSPNIPGSSYSLPPSSINGQSSSYGSVSGNSGYSSPGLMNFYVPGLMAPNPNTAYMAPVHPSTTYAVPGLTSLSQSYGYPTLSDTNLNYGFPNFHVPQGSYGLPLGPPVSSTYGIPIQSSSYGSSGLQSPSEVYGTPNGLVPPNTYNFGNSGTILSQSYGTPYFGMPSPSYATPNVGTPSQSYGTPNVGAPSTSYATPNVGTPSQSYGTPNVGTPSTSYATHNVGTPSQSYGTPNVGTPSTSYATPNVGTPAQSYGTPNVGTPSTSYATPNVGTPAQSYGTPNIGTPSTSYATPNVGTPSQSYGTPNVGTPSTSYATPNVGTPAQSYGTPNVGTPSTSYATPNVGTPNQSYGTPNVGTPSPSYTTPNVGTPSTSYETPNVRTPGQSYGTPNVGTPSPSYGTPNVVMPSQNYRVPNIRTPTQSYNTPILDKPISGFGTPHVKSPSQTYGTVTGQKPPQSYGSPTVNNPSPSYATPNVKIPSPSYGTPNIKTPSQSYGTPNNPATSPPYTLSPKPVGYSYSAPTLKPSTQYAPPTESKGYTIAPPRIPEGSYGPPKISSTSYGVRKPLAPSSNYSPPSSSYTVGSTLGVSNSYTAPGTSSYTPPKSSISFSSDNDPQHYTNKGSSYTTSTPSSTFTPTPSIIQSNSPSSYDRRPQSNYGGGQSNSPSSYDRRPPSTYGGGQSNSPSSYDRKPPSTYGGGQSNSPSSYDRKPPSTYGGGQSNSPSSYDQSPQSNYGSPTPSTQRPSFPIFNFTPIGAVTPVPMIHHTTTVSYSYDPPNNPVPSLVGNTIGNSYGLPSNTLGTSYSIPSTLGNNIGNTYNLPPLTGNTIGTSYSVPSITDNTISTSYIAPAITGNILGSSYGTPSVAGSIPSNSYGTPSLVGNIPSNTYGTPLITGITPSDSYGTPSITTSTPNYSYGIPLLTGNTLGSSYVTPRPLINQYASPYQQTGRQLVNPYLLQNQQIAANNYLQANFLAGNNLLQPNPFVVSPYLQNNHLGANNLLFPYGNQNPLLVNQFGQELQQNPTFSNLPFTTFPNQQSYGLPQQSLQPALTPQFTTQQPTYSTGYDAPPQQPPAIYGTPDSAVTGAPSLSYSRPVRNRKRYNSQRTTSRGRYRTLQGDHSDGHSTDFQSYSSSTLPPAKRNYPNRGKQMAHEDVDPSLTEHRGNIRRSNSHQNSQFEETNDQQTDDSDKGGNDNDNGGDYSIEETDYDSDKGGNDNDNGGDYSIEETDYDSDKGGNDNDNGGDYSIEETDYDSDEDQPFR